MIPLTYKAISLPHLSFKCLLASILQSWKTIISAAPWEERRVNQLWLLTNQMSTINYNTNQFIRLLASSLSDQLLRNFYTEDKKWQSRTLIRVSEVWNTALKQTTAQYSKVGDKCCSAVWLPTFSVLRAATDISPAGVSLHICEVSFFPTKLKIFRNAAYLPFLPVPCLN